MDCQISIIIKKLYFYSLKKSTNRKAGRGLLLADSLPKCPESTWITQAKIILTRNSVQVSHGQRRKPGLLLIACNCFLRYISRELDWKHISHNIDQCSHRTQKFPMSI